MFEVVINVGDNGAASTHTPSMAAISTQQPSNKHIQLQLPQVFPREKPKAYIYDLQEMVRNRGLHQIK